MQKLIDEIKKKVKILIVKKQSKEGFFCISKEDIRIIHENNVYLVVDKLSLEK